MGALDRRRRRRRRLRRRLKMCPSACLVCLGRPTVSETARSDEGSWKTQVLMMASDVQGAVLNALRRKNSIKVAKWDRWNVECQSGGGKGRQGTPEKGLSKEACGSRTAPRATYRNVVFSTNSGAISLSASWDGVRASTRGFRGCSRSALLRFLASGGWGEDGPIERRSHVQCCASVLTAHVCR